MGKFEDILWETWRISWGNFVESYGVSLEVQFVGIQRVELRMISLGLVARGVHRSLGPPILAVFRQRRDMAEPVFPPFGCFNEPKPQAQLEKRACVSARWCAGGLNKNGLGSV